MNDTRTQIHTGLATRKGSADNLTVTVVEFGWISGFSLYIFKKHLFQPSFNFLIIFYGETLSVVGSPVIYSFCIFTEYPKYFMTFVEFRNALLVLSCVG